MNKIYAKINSSLDYDTILQSIVKEEAKALNAESSVVIEEGEWTTWWANGFKKDKGSYLNGEKNGFWQEWTVDYGWAEGNYLNGKKVGGWKSLAPD